jgi:molecular chaperone DnaK (HSP70)
MDHAYAHPSVAVETLDNLASAPGVAELQYYSAVSLEGGHVPLTGGSTASAVGIETRGGVLTPLIRAGTKVPNQRTEIFTTADDGQLSIKVSVFHGSGTHTVDAHLLGRYELMLNENSLRGVPQIHVTFEVDAGGVFRIAARDSDGREVWIAPAS